MTFTYVPSQLDTHTTSQIRLEIGDKVEGKGILPGGANLQDEEIEYYLGLSTDRAEVLYRIFTMLAGQWANQADYALGPVKESYSQVSAAFQRRADLWKTETAGMGGATSTPFIKDDGYSDDVPFGNYTAKNMTGDYQ
jgi:hypothetical protein